MKNLYITGSHWLLIVPVLLICTVFLSANLSAQAGDTLLVRWETVPGSLIPEVNALRDAIMTDNDRPEGRVYKLERGGYYWITDRIENSGFHLRIVGETPGDDIETAPAVIQRVHPEEGSIDTRIITGMHDMTLKNLWISGADDEGVQTAYQPVQIDASDRRFVFDNVVFERSNFAIPAFTGARNTIIFRNCVFRNLVGKPSDQQWQGRGISIWADQDTVIVENNTFFNVNMTVLQIEGGAANYIRFNHNTIVHLGRSLNAGSWFRTAYFTNNLFINPFFHGEGNADLTDPNRQPGSYHAGIFSIGALPAVYGPNIGRRIVYAKNAAWRDPAFEVFYGDTIRAQPHISTLSKPYFNDYEQIVIADTSWLGSLPAGFDYPDDDNHIQKMINNINQLRTGADEAVTYFYKLPTIPGTEEISHVAINWPLPENFSYDASDPLYTAGVGNLPLGDLNWFPDKKAQWEADRDAYVQQVEELAGEEIIVTVIGRAEAEEGTLDGDAEIVDFGGELPYFRMEGGGFIEWEFEMAEAATIELIITTRSNDAMRGQHVRVNGTALKNDAGFGEYMWFDLDPEEWKDYLVTQDDLVEGAEALNVGAGINTLRIAPSWGWQQFLQVQVLVGGSVVHTLNSGNTSEYEIVELISPVVIPHFKMEGGGFIRWEFEMEEAATISLIITTRSQDAVRGEHVRVNGTALRNDTGFGEFMWFDLHPENWQDYLITQADLIEGAEALELDAGTHTLEIAPSWGWQEFLMVKVLVGDVVIHQLTSLNVTEFEIVQVISEGGPPTSGFKSVALGADGGSITWAFEVTHSEHYSLNVFYQAPQGTQSGEIRIDGVKVADFVYEGEVDDLTIRGKMSPYFFLTEGIHEITLTGANVDVDWVQLLEIQGVSVPWDPTELPDGFSLYQNYPNPFNPATTIRYRITNTEKIVLKVYNILGQEVKTLVNEVQIPGTYQVTFDASHLASGMYIYRLQAGGFTEVKKMMFIK